MKIEFNKYGGAALIPETGEEREKLEEFYNTGLVLVSSGKVTYEDVLEKVPMTVYTKR